MALPVVRPRGSLSIRNLTRRKRPGLPFAKAARMILPQYELSLVFVGARRAKTLNKRLRGKSYVPNVLAYDVGPKSAEIIICLDRVQKESSGYDLAPRAYCLFLFIHALLHLKGYRHGTTMERRERAYLVRLVYVPSSNGTTHSNWHRPRVASNENRRRRGGTR